MEYGGCLYFEPLILPERGGYYDTYFKNKIDVDSGRSAIQWILENIVDYTLGDGMLRRARFKRIWIPVYNCPLIADRIKRVSNLKICQYNLQDDFCPEVSEAELGEEDILLWVNYCGVVRDEVIDKVAGLKKSNGCEIIIDNIPAYFAKPRMDVINIYSCRKFLGVPDGGHVIGKDIEQQELPTYSSANNYIYLLKAVESGSNSAYAGYQENERRFQESDIAYGMPFLSKKILGLLNYTDIIERRKQNFDILHQILGGSNRFSERYSGIGNCTERININSRTPSVYPYLASRRELRKRLISSKVFVSRFWEHVLTNDRANSFEKDMAEYLIPLPIDQRYSSGDIENLGIVVKEMELK